MPFSASTMMRDCAERAFDQLPAGKQRYLPRTATAHGTSAAAVSPRTVRLSQKRQFDALLRVIQSDAGILLAALKPVDVLDALGECPVSVLKAHPLALLVLMRRMFTWRQIPKMMELKALLLASIEERPAMPAAERGDLLGECDLIMSSLPQ